MASAATAVSTIQCKFFYHGLTTLDSETITALKITTHAGDIIARLSHATGNAAQPLCIEAKQLSPDQGASDSKQPQDDLICSISELSKLQLSLQLTPKSQQEAQTTVTTRSVPIKTSTLPDLQGEESVHVVVYYPKETTQPQADFILPNVREETSPPPVPTALIGAFQQQAEALADLIHHSLFRIDEIDCISLLASMEIIDAAMQKKMAAELDLLPTPQLKQDYTSAQQALAKIDQELETALQSKEGKAIAKAAKECREYMGDFNNLAAALRRRNLAETAHSSYLHIIVEPDSQYVFFKNPLLQIQSMS